MRILLISNSTLYGSGYLDHCAEAIVSFLGPAVRRVLFVPDALFDRDAYTAKARARFERMGLALDSVHDVSVSPPAARPEQADDLLVEASRMTRPERADDLLARADRSVNEAEALFVGGGNTFRLLDALHREGLIEPIRRRVRAGLPYVGSSAGSNVACPTIKTTNDMPIIQPPSLAALNLVPFQINPHYQDPVANSTHMGETREERILEFLEENDTPVVGLREGAWLVVDDQTVALQGSTGARLFRRGRPAAEVASGSRLDFLLGER